jgi:rhodanese-related sulfurtransferase
MLPATMLRSMDFEDALAHVEQGAAFVDLRPTNDYLEVHIPGSLSLVYEFGPGMASRARDCLPLDLALILLTDAGADMANAAAALKGKGFTVLGELSDAVNAWMRSGRPAASTEVVEGSRPPAGLLLDVGDPGASLVDDALGIPVERLWARVREVRSEEAVVVVAGAGVRAGLAVGMLEHANHEDVVFWKSRA